VRIHLQPGGIVLIAGQSLSEMFSQRVPLYEKYADITVDCEDEDFEEVMGKVIGELKEEGGF